MSETTNNQAAARKINFQSVKPITPLELIKQVVDNINTQILSLDLELLNASQGDTSSIKELSANVHEIVQKSIQAKAVIEEVTKDPTKLKTINSKIIRSADVLKKINKLLDSLGELEQELISGEFDYYRVISELLLDVQKQISHFDAYQAIPHIIQVRNKLNTIENELRRQIQWNFREIGQLNPSLADEDNNSSNNAKSNNSSSSVVIESSIDINSLSQVSLVIDALGEMFRHDLLERFAQLQLIPYEKIFHVGGSKFSGLEHFDRRYAWFKKLLKVADDKVSSIFPAHWMLPFYLFQEFSRRTKKHIHDNLTLLENSPQAKSDPSAYVQSLLKALKSIITFEAEMKSSFEVYSHGLDVDPKLIQMIRGDAAPVTTTAANTENSTAGGDGRKSLSESQDNSNNDSSTTNNSNDSYNIVSSTNSMADAFDAFLGPYVQLERQELDTLMTKIMVEEAAFFATTNSHGRNNKTSGSTELENENMLLKPGDPFISSRKMFEFIKKSLKRCTSYSTGQTYLALSREFRICLHNYAESLKFRCPSPEYTQPGKPLVYNVTMEMEEVLCRIIITGEYCIDTVPQLENMMKKHIRVALVSEIDFTDQIDMFNDMVAFTIGILTQGITQRVYPVFKKMRDMNWTQQANQNVVDECAYVKEAISIFNDTIPRIRSAIPVIFFQSFCMKLVTSSLDSYLDNIWKLKRITQTGAGQLLLDLNGLKEYLMRMPNSRLPTDSTPLVISNPYKNLVNTRIAEIQVILKLVCTDDDKMEEMFALLWPDGKQSDLENIVALKSRGGNNLLLAPVNVVGDHLKEHTEKLGNMVLGQKATGDIKSGLGGIKNNVKSSFGGFSNAFGEMSKALTGDLFIDSSGASGSRSSGSSHGQLQSSQSQARGLGAGGGSNANNNNNNNNNNSTAATANSVKRPGVSASVNSAATSNTTGTTTTRLVAASTNNVTTTTSKPK